MICPLDEHDFCARHQRPHLLREKALSQMDNRLGRRYRRLWDRWAGIGGDQVADQLPCIHRGAEVRKQECPSCVGSVGLSVFACAVHGECTLGKQLEGVARCRGCRAREPHPPPPLPAPGEAPPATPAELGLKRAVVINLDRRPDRLQEFLVATIGLQSSALWDRIERVPAIDGQLSPHPGNWRGGLGAWGCRQSHLRVLEDALRDGVETLTVFEDDCVFMADFGLRLEVFLARVPRDWQGLMLGCEHQTKAPPIAEGVRRVLYAQRTHAYVVRGRDAMRALYTLWAESRTHIDHSFGRWQEAHRVYCPDPLLCGQGAGPSDIVNRTEETRFWQGARQ